MKLVIQKWDDNAAVRLPSSLLGLLNVAIGDKLTVDVRPEGIMLKKKRPTYSLEELVAQCDLTAKEPADMAAWKKIKPAGREV